jgi:serine/threonine protein phosphatase PrpC
MSKRRPRPATGAIVGRRAEQQDAVLAEAVERDDGAPGLLLIVADGMGGHAGGQVASQIAIETFAGAFRMGRALPVGERLRAALDIANRAVGAKVLERPELGGMGCTLVAALVFGDRVQWISVGDSILAAIRNRQLIRLNADHSMAPEIDRAVLEGRISQAQADSDPDRHVLLSALSGGRIAIIDEGQQRLGAGAFVLLASDGLLSLPASRIAEIGSGPLSAERKVAALLEAVAQDMPDDQDNTAIAAVHCGRALPAGGGRRGWRRAVGLLLLLLALAGAFYVVWLLAGTDGPRAAPEGGNAGRPATPALPTPGGAGIRGPTIEAPRPRSKPVSPRRPPGKDVVRPAEPGAAVPGGNSAAPATNETTPPPPAPSPPRQAPATAPSATPTRAGGPTPRQPGPRP